MKSENLAISMGIVAEQVFRISPDEHAANQRLYQMGLDMGTRIADEFTSRKCSYLSPAETTKAMLSLISEQYLGMKMELTADSVRYEKKFHYYDLQYTVKQKDISKSILGYCEDAIEQYPKFMPESLPAGILTGVLQTMNILGVVQPKRSSGDIVFEVTAKKEIKQED